MHSTAFGFKSCTTTLELGVLGIMGLGMDNTHWMVINGVRWFLVRYHSSLLSFVFLNYLFGTLMATIPRAVNSEEIWMNEN
ncbi:hypothetical protein BKA65DRAFT_302828 [Rhexocercosporidium sp. MPI-PUGE-AT-0058]|nr:hypothetical protein BKA65DRAFT_302828 [Rhexocercosporidium sp. MPI-PUGE-AT-0058]